MDKCTQFSDSNDEMQTKLKSVNKPDYFWVYIFCVCLELVSILGEYSLFVLFCFGSFHFSWKSYSIAPIHSPDGGSKLVNRLHFNFSNVHVDTSFSYFISELNVVILANFDRLLTGFP